jgi:hypothetical protein
MKKIFFKTINLTKYIFEYLGIIEKNVSISNKINFGSENSNIFFYKLLKKSKLYLEYGSGSSTLLAEKLNKKFLSIENDKGFYKKLKKKLKNNNENSIKYIDLGPTKYDAIPIIPSFFLKKKIIEYGNQIVFFYKKFKKIPDLILIDGRFRVFICLSILKFLIQKKQSTTIILDDYIYRKNYNILEKFFKVKIINRFAILKINNFKLNTLNYNMKRFIYDYR